MFKTDIDTIRRRLRVKTKTVGDCEEWQGRLKDGYGEITIDGKDRRVHRVTWQIERGAIPDGLGVLHTCDNRRCRKLSHLFLGDAAINNLDRDSKGRGSAGRRAGHGHAKLSEDDVAAIRADPAPARVLAFTHDVTVETIRKIRRGETWGDDPEQTALSRKRRRREREVSKENKERRAAGLPPLPRATHGTVKALLS